MKPSNFVNWIADENNRIYVLLIGFSVTLTLFWLVIIKSFVPPLPIYDEWKTLQPYSGGNVLTWIYESQHEQISVIEKLCLLFAYSTGFGYWRLPYLGVLFNGLTSVFIVSFIRKIRGTSHFTDVIIPLALFHSSLVWGYFRPDMTCFAFLTGTASIAMTMLAVPAEKSAPWHQYVIGLCLILLSVNTSTGVVYAAFLGGIYFFKNLLFLRKGNRNTVIAVILFTVIAAALSLGYVLSIRCASFTVSGINQSTFADKFECSITGIGAALGELGLFLRWKAGVLILLFVCFSLAALLFQFRRSAVSLSTLMTSAGLLFTCCVSPVIIGITRGGWSDVALRHMFILMQFPVALCLCWITLESVSKWSVFLRNSFFVLFIVSFIYSCPTIGLLGVDKLILYNKVMADIEQGLPVEFIAARNSFGLSMYSANILESHMKVFQERRVRPFDQIKDFTYESASELSIPQCIIEHNAKRDDVSGRYSGENATDAYLEIRLPEKMYVKAIQIEFSMTAEFTEKESVPRCNVSCFSRNDKGAVAAYEQCTLIILEDANNALNVWIDAEIDSILFKPSMDNFSLNVKSIKVYK